MRVFPVFAATLLACAAASPQEPLQRADPGGRQPGSGVSPPGAPTQIDTMPEEIRALRLPDSFAWVTGTERQVATGDRVSMVRFRTTLGADQAQDIALSALVSGGWQRTDAARLTAMPTIFVSIDRPQPVRACRDGKMISVNVSPQGMRSDVTFNVQPGTTGCTQAASFRQMPAHAFSPYLPILELPPEPEGGPVGPGGSSGGYQDGMVNVRVQFMSAGNPSLVATHFAAQLAAQGWTRHVTSNGETTAGSAWSRLTDSQRTIHATLQVIHMGHRQFTALFRALGTPSQTQDIPGEEELLNGWLFNQPPGTALSVVRELPDWMAGIDIPAGFELIGSGARPGDEAMTVAFSSSLAIPEARDQWLGLFVAEGWQLENMMETPVFVLFNQQRLDLLCRQGIRRISRVREIAGTTYVSILGVADSAQQPQRACHAIPAQEVAFEIPGLNALRSLAPKLAFPDSAREAPGSFTSNTGTNGAVTFTTGIRSPDGLHVLARHLAAQMPTQGWIADATWSGAVSAGSTWRRDAEGGTPAWAVLEIADLGEGQIEARLNLISQPVSMSVPSLGERWVAR